MFGAFVGGSVAVWARRLQGAAGTVSRANLAAFSSNKKLQKAEVQGLHRPESPTGCTCVAFVVEGRPFLLSLPEKEQQEAIEHIDEVQNEIDRWVPG